MTDPEQVLVNVAELRDLIGAAVGSERHTRARTNLLAAIPEPEWEPTDDMRAKARRVLPHHDDDAIDEKLRAFHGVGLL